MHRWMMTTLWHQNTSRTACPSPLDSPWWRHQMETFTVLLALCAGNSPVTVNSQHKGQWRGAVMFSLIWAWMNGWVTNREAGNFRRHRAHYDVTMMLHKRPVNVEFWCFFVKMLVAVERTVELLLILDVPMFIWCQCNMVYWEIEDEKCLTI